MKQNISHIKYFIYKIESFFVFVLARKQKVNRITKKKAL